ALAGAGNRAAWAEHRLERGRRRGLRGLRAVGAAGGDRAAHGSRDGARPPADGPEHAAAGGRAAAAGRCRGAVRTPRAAQCRAGRPAVSAAAWGPILSPIDKALGGEAMVGLKTPLAIVAYAALWIMQTFDAVGPATGDKATATGSVLTALI